MSEDVLQNLQLAATTLMEAGIIPTTTYPRRHDSVLLLTTRELLLYFLSTERAASDAIELDTLVLQEQSANVLSRAICNACKAAGLTQRKCVTMLRKRTASREEFTNKFVQQCKRKALADMPLGPPGRRTQVKLWAIPVP